MSDHVVFVHGDGVQVVSVGAVGPSGESDQRAGGTTNQVLAKLSNADFDTGWVDPAAGGTWGGITGTLSNQTDLQAALDGKQPLDSDLTAIAALTTTAYGRAFLALADAAAGRTALGLGTAATSASTAFDAAGAAAAAQGASQPLDSDLTAIAALTTTSFGRALLALADAAALRTAAGLGTLATQNGTFSGTSSGTNTGDQTITLTGDVTGSGTGSFAATIADGAVTLAKQANMATASVVYRKTAGAGAPEVQTLATLKTDLALTGTNSGDQTITLTGDATGSGTGSFAVNVGKLNGTSLAGLATGILKNTTTTGVPSIAVAGDFPTLNQNTTGSAATLTTARNIDGQAFDGSAAITVIAPGTHAATSKATPVDADELPLVDSAASNVLKKLSWANVKATLKTYLDTLYQAVLVSGTNIKTINSTSLLGAGDIAVVTSPGGSNGQPQGNISSAFAAIPNWTFDTTSGVQTYSFATTANTAAEGVTVASSGTASAGNQHFSPRVHWKGFGWKTTATAAAQAVEFIAEVQPVQGTTAPTGNWKLRAAINGGSYADALTVDTSGNATVTTLTVSSNLQTFQTVSSNILGLNSILQASGFRMADSTAAIPGGGFTGVYLGTGNSVVFSSTGNWFGTADLGISRTSAKVGEINSGTAGTYPGTALVLGIQTVAQLPAAATGTKGARATVSDATTTTFMGALTGGGANIVPVFCNGSAWVIG